MNTRILAGCICSIALACQVLAAFGQAEPDSFKPDEKLVTAVSKAKVITTGYPIHVMRSGNEVMVTTLENPKSNERSTKIDAVLIAKAIMDSEKNVLIVHYRVKKQMRDSSFNVITVRQSDVMAYGVNAINVDSLLGQLRINHRTARRPGFGTGRGAGANSGPNSGPAPGAGSGAR